jgi:hypothetical protein
LRLVFVSLLLFLAFFPSFRLLQRASLLEPHHNRARFKTVQKHLSAQLPAHFADIAQAQPEIR